MTYRVNYITNDGILNSLDLPFTDNPHLKDCDIRYSIAQALSRRLGMTHFKIVNYFRL